MKRYAVLVFFSFLFSFQAFSQNHFPYGPCIYEEYIDNNVVNEIKGFGINTIIAYANSTRKPYLEMFENSIACNTGPFDYIHNYTLGYYNKWEAEEDLTNSNNAGIKHKIGIPDNIDDIDCWAIPENVNYEPDEIFIYGPHSAQEAEFRRTPLTIMLKLERYQVRHSMTTYDVQLVIQQTKEKYPLARPRLITDNGSQYCSKIFKVLSKKPNFVIPELLLLTPNQMVK